MSEDRYIFITKDPQNRVVALDTDGLSHVHEEHPDISSELIKSVLERPDFITRNTRHGSLNYLRVRLATKEWVIVAAKEVKIRDTDWIVMTCYVAEKLPEGVEKIWP